MPSPRAVRWEQKEGNMKRFEFTLQEFWERCDCLVFDAKTGEQIDDKVMLANKDLEVLSFEPKSSYDKRLKMWTVDGIAVTLESEDDEE